MEKELPAETLAPLSDLDLILQLEVTFFPVVFDPTFSILRVCILRIYQDGLTLRIISARASFPDEAAGVRK